MSTRHLGFAVFSLCLAIYVPACEYDQTTGTHTPQQPSGSGSARASQLSEPVAIDSVTVTVSAELIEPPAARAEQPAPPDRIAG